MKISISLLLFVFIGITSHAQSDYFINGKDTIRGTWIRYKLTSQSYLSEISYIDAGGNRINLKERKNLTEVSSFHRSDQIIDKIPQKANKPKSYVKWANRVVDGKLIVNYYFNTISTIGVNGTTTGIMKFFIKMPDGTYYDIRKSSDLRKHIIPYLKECSEFVSAYKGDYSKNYESFVETIMLYNSVCK